MAFIMDDAIQFATNSVLVQRYLGPFLFDHRQSTGLTLAEISIRTGLSIQTLESIEFRTFRSQIDGSMLENIKVGYHIPNQDWENLFRIASVSNLGQLLRTIEDEP